MKIILNVYFEIEMKIDLYGDFLVYVWFFLFCDFYMFIGKELSINLYK